MDGSASEFIEDYFRRDENEEDEDEIRSSPESPDEDDHGDSGLVVCAAVSTGEGSQQEVEEHHADESPVCSSSLDEDSSCQSERDSASPPKDQEKLVVPMKTRVLNQHKEVEETELVGDSKTGNAAGALQRDQETPNKLDGPGKCAITSPHLQGIKCEEDENTTLTTHCRRSQRLSGSGEADVQFYFQCGLCQDTFTSVTEMQLHTRLLHSDPFLGGKEPEYPGRKDSLSPGVAHNSVVAVSLHKEAKGFSCRYCDKRFKRSLPLYEHVRHHCLNAVPPFKCEVCDKEFDYFPPLVQHEESHRGKKGKTAAVIRCPECQKIFTSRQGLRQHATLHTGEKRYQCKICPKKFRLPGDLRRHVKTHSDNKRFHCKICGETFIHQHQYTSHEKRHVDGTPELAPLPEVKVEALYRCQFCQEAFTTTTQLKIHQRVHKGENHGETGCADWTPHSAPRTPHSAPRTLEDILYKCQFCEKAFTSRTQLRNHENVHKGVKPHKCSLCEEAFTVSQSLVKHMRYHTGERPYQCSTCGKGFVGSGLLRAHERVHTNYRPHVCEVCGKAFSYQNGLVLHRRSHTGEKPYGCGVCGKTYRTSGTLTIHKRTHTGEKPYQCEYCEKSFISSGSLTSHRQVHGVVRPSRKNLLQCSYCEEMLQGPQNLKRHERVHRGEDPYQCSGCGAGQATVWKYRQHRKICTEVAAQRTAEGDEKD